MKKRWIDYQSPLAPWIKHYLTYKHALGRRFDNEEKAFHLLDRYLIEEIPINFYKRKGETRHHLCGEYYTAKD